MIKKSEELKIAIKAAEEAGKIIRNHFNKKISKRLKSGTDYVTNADIECEKKIISIIKKKFPEHNFIGEESGNHNTKSNFAWHIDPIDGTTNFVYGHYELAVSIALEKDNEIIAGVVYNPIINEMFYAEKNKGAYLNNKKIKVRNEKKVRLATVSVSAGRRNLLAKRLPFVFAVEKEIHNIRNFGSAALHLCYAACGRIDAVLEPLINSWDVAAGILIAEEAGAKVTNFEGGKWLPMKGDVFAANKNLHKKILRIIKKCQ